MELNQSLGVTEEMMKPGYRGQLGGFCEHAGVRCGFYGQ
jgi:hypothetical protein